MIKSVTVCVCDCFFFKLKNETNVEINRKAQNVMVKNLNFLEEEVDIELDQCHRLRPTRDGKESTVVRFRLHALQSKNIPETNRNQIEKKIKVKFSLTRHETRTIKYAHQIMENNEEVNFVYTYMNGNLKLRLHNSKGNKYVYEFISKEELHELFNKFDWEIPELYNQI